ncbi:hypothetical protein CXG81DRAFT_20410 [Caulochytrium protostelioides]|uniref:Uncharacterized protein n=1 Tax=Caulochytrium protostelioides TaxID=1555241 RepID=A0A4P9X3A2_9FUNG|nr:hypothetical protein CXG81DRAFT_20410 [Caulochytrium protostelioides]|eukprot:RKO99496.1 hypothetical protein CXG81DRAFT_20410 [Caulochytrium protostelioides]
MASRPRTSGPAAAAAAAAPAMTATVASAAADGTRRADGSVDWKAIQALALRRAHAARTDIDAYLDRLPSARRAAPASAAPVSAGHQSARRAIEQLYAREGAAAGHDTLTEAERRLRGRLVSREARFRMQDAERAAAAAAAAAPTVTLAVGGGSSGGGAQGEVAVDARSLIAEQRKRRMPEAERAEAEAAAAKAAAVAAAHDAKKGGVLEKLGRGILASNPASAVSPSPAAAAPTTAAGAAPPSKFARVSALDAYLNRGPKKKKR